MGWRSIIINNPAYLSLAQNSLQIASLDEQQSIARVSLEDISVLLIENPNVTLTTKLLAACAESQIVLITVGDNYLPNGMLLPYLPHSRALKVMKSQLKLSVVKKKQLWQEIIQQKIRNQSSVLLDSQQKTAAQRLMVLANAVRSGDTTNREALSGQIYFRALFGPNFSRLDNCFYNSALNYGYAVVRAAIARTLCSYGFLPAFGLFHRNELNAFNLADDIIEPYRPIIDSYVVKEYMFKSPNGDIKGLTTKDKVGLVNLLHQDIQLNEYGGNSMTCTLLAGIDATISSLSRIVLLQKSVTTRMSLPWLTIKPAFLDKNQVLE